MTKLNVGGAASRTFDATEGPQKDFRVRMLHFPPFRTLKTSGMAAHIWLLAVLYATFVTSTLLLIWHRRHIRWFEVARRRLQKATAFYPVLPHSVVAALASVAVSPSLLIPSCVIDAFIPSHLRSDTTRARAVGAVTHWLLSDPRHFARLCANTRREHRGRIGPRIAAALTAVSLASIGNSTFLDLCAARALAKAHNVRLDLGVLTGSRPRFFFVNPCGASTIEAAIVGNRSRAHMVRRDEYLAHTTVEEVDYVMSDELCDESERLDRIMELRRRREAADRCGNPFLRLALLRSPGVMAEGSGAPLFAHVAGGPWRIGARPSRGQRARGGHGRVSIAAAREARRPRHLAHDTDSDEEGEAGG